MLGGLGNDAMIGGAGEDAYQVDSPGDSVIELEDGGIDTVYVSLAGYALPANVEIARLTGSANAVSGGDVAEQLVANPSLATLLNGAGGDDVLYGQGLDDTLVGSSGDDVLRGGEGNDSLVGGPGNDQAVIEQAGDVFIENADEGIDTAYVTVQGWTLALNAEIGRLAGTATLLLGSGGGQSLVANPLYGSTLLAGEGPDTLYGSSLPDTLDGGPGDDVLRGGPGSDLLRGGTGNDSYVIEELGDLIQETDGYDVAYVAVDNYVLAPGVEVSFLSGTATHLTGSEQSETLVASGLAGCGLDGRDGADTLYGSPFGDLLAGGLGNDVDWGFGGADLFAFHIANWGQDTVMDFNRAEGDLLDFRGSGITSFGQLTVAMNGPDAALIGGANSVTLQGVTSVTAADCFF